ncbi:MAG: response regulator transcription factor [Actinomycetales bacterium]
MTRVAESATGDRLLRAVIIDDTPDIRDLLTLVLETLGGFTVVETAADGRAGIVAVTTHCPDVVMLDLAMPVMDGLEALPAIRGICPHAAIIVLSGFDATAMTASALRAGADAYLQKGAKPDVIVATVREVLERRGRS